MNFPLLQLLASGIALGMMGGSAAIHSLHVSGAAEVAESNRLVTAGAELAMEPGSDFAPAVAMMGGTASPMRPEALTVSQRETTATVEALEEIVARLQELKAENERLQGQVEETNRDFLQMQFRLDTYDGSFRPMPVSPSSILEGSISPGGTIHPLLPPK